MNGPYGSTVVLIHLSARGRLSYFVFTVNEDPDPVHTVVTLLDIGPIRMYILMLGTRNVEQTKDVRMYIEEFILVDVVTLLYMDEVNNIGKILVYIHSQQRI